MKRFAWRLAGTTLLAGGVTWGVACGSSPSSTSTFSSDVGGAVAGTTASTSTTGGGQGGASTTSSTTEAATTATTSGTGGSSSPCGSCPTGSTCGSANGIPVCRAASGIPIFSHVFVVLMENTSLSTLQSAMTGGTAPNLTAMTSTYATGSDYHGVAHPSLPNYLALTSGGTQNVVCDCSAQPGLGTCSGTALVCEADIALGFACSCPNMAMNLADQLEAAGKTWMAFGESMGTPCNLTDSGNYAQRHVPFLYYDDIQTNATRCDTHVVDFTHFSPASAVDFNYIAPNLIDDMHNPNPPTAATTVNIPNGDTWIGPQVTAITASAAYKNGGLLVVVWDEDDDSGGVLGDTDDPVGIFVLSPYAKSGGYVSSVMANHYSLLATFEDGLGLPRLGSAVTATPLADYFPAN
jgi:phosphatidylinositol-3-phosphatase